MVDLVAEGGYEAVTIRNLARRAGVSTHTFYEHYDGKEECFLATYELVELSLAERVRAAVDGEEDWEERLRLGFSAFAREVASRPEAARLALIESFAGGPAALERIRRARTSFETIFAESFSLAPDRPTVPPLILKGIVSGVARVSRARLLAGREGEMPSLVQPQLEWVLSLRAGPEDLKRIDRRIPPGSPSVSSISAMTAELAKTMPEDRALIIDAVARLAASEGYWRLSVPRIRAEAGISRKSFDAHFKSVEDCFLAMVEALTGLAVASAAREGRSAETWAGGVYRAIAVLCAGLARNRPLARVAFIEVFAPGPDGMRRREALIDRVVGLLREAAPTGQAPSELGAEASAGGVWGLLHHHVADGETERLPEIAGTLAFLVLAPALGAGAAVEQIAAEQCRLLASAPKLGPTPS